MALRIKVLTFEVSGYGYPLPIIGSLSHLRFYLLNPVYQRKAGKSDLLLYIGSEMA